VTTTERPMTNPERLANWYAKAATVDAYLMTGPRVMADFGRVFAREYEAEAIADAAPTLENYP